MLLHTGDGPNLLMSIPRDSLVEVPGHGTTKINAAYAYGGPKLLVKTIENETGIRVDDYVEVGFGGVVDMVDAVGGIEICPTQSMKDKLANLDIKKGCQEVDGKTALAYARSRHTVEHRRHRPGQAPARGGLRGRQRGRVPVDASSTRSATGTSTWRCPTSFAFGEGTGPLRAAKWASAMTNVNGEDGLTCGVPITDLAVHWDAERSKQMFGHIIEDTTDEIPKGLCTPTGLPEERHGLIADGLRDAGLVGRRGRRRHAHPRPPGRAQRVRPDDGARARAGVPRRRRRRRRPRDRGHRRRPRVLRRHGPLGRGQRLRARRDAAADARRSSATHLRRAAVRRRRPRHRRQGDARDPRLPEAGDRRHQRRRRRHRRHDDPGDGPAAGLDARRGSASSSAGSASCPRPRRPGSCPGSSASSRRWSGSTPPRS